MPHSHLRMINSITANINPLASLVRVILYYDSTEKPLMYIIKQVSLDAGQN